MSSSSSDANYSSYIQSEQWRVKRLKRLEIDGFKCQTCNWNHQEDLQVHHKYDGSRQFRYPKPLGEEIPEEDLITLCKWCHEAITDSARRRRYAANGLSVELDDYQPIHTKTTIEVRNGRTTIEIQDYGVCSADSSQRSNRRSFEPLRQSIETDFE